MRIHSCGRWKSFGTSRTLIYSYRLDSLRDALSDLPFVPLRDSGRGPRSVTSVDLVCRLSCLATMGLRYPVLSRVAIRNTRRHGHVETTHAMHLLATKSGALRAVWRLLCSFCFSLLGRDVQAARREALRMLPISHGCGRDGEQPYRNCKPCDLTDGSHACFHSSSALRRVRFSC